ncbi:hypothetical protein IW261DRAFT_1514166 [Armillaria novae-zelandiae]|uniref:F-box domain-containing protein n=1 Tax=Armillaria novae-zelandiae TaxID=153914 RepID=A0AA39U9Z6_9AGAR|nr:hypothetical protein IW261DRAFT_1514166 [Armillaria novae-zelandiae]
MSLRSESTGTPSPSLPSPSRIKYLLRCSDPLLEAEKTALRSLVDEAPSTLANLDQQIIEVRMTLDSLIQKRQVAESDFNNAKALLHPIRLMPHDVLAEIFEQCVPGDRGLVLFGQIYHDSLDPRLAPWSISHVSKLWRDIALSLPHLWDRVILDFRNYEALSGKTLLTKVALLLQRSKDVDLFVALLSPYKLLSGHPAFVLLEISAPRWKKLSIFIKRSCLQALSSVSFTRLRELLALAYPENQRHVAPPVNTFQKANSLRLVAILGNENGVSFPLPWSRVETYAYDLYGTGGWDCLKQLTTLKSLDITNSCQTTRLSELPQITLPTVRTLQISERKNHPDTEIIAELIRRTSNPSFPLSHQLPNSLTTLVIQDAMEDIANTGRVLQFLQTVPSVEKLVIDGRCGNEFFQGVSIQPGKGIILPNLRVLRHQWVRKRFPDLAVLDFIESRCRRDAGHEAVNGENYDASQPRQVSLQEIDLCEVELVPLYKDRLDDLRQKVRIIYTC